MDKGPKAGLLRRIPQVEQIINTPSVGDLIARTSRSLVLSEINKLLDHIRRRIINQELSDGQIGQVLSNLEEDLQKRVYQRLSPGLKPVVNATGVIIHTNLGRALLSENAVQALKNAARNYTNLEFDLALGERSARDKHVSRLLSELLGCEDAAVVNNNAAMVFLILNTLASGKEVIVSRGELVEIGGSFRIPEIMERSGAKLREVGTTNKTKISDYVAAVSEQTALILRVHPSNYKIIGFTERPQLADLVEVTRKFNIAIVEDLGSGCLVDLSPYGIVDEPVVQQSLKEGVDLACFSADKLLGGPQAGIVVGREDLIKRLRKNPLMRMLRVDKLTFSALDATLLSYLREKAFEELPVLSMIAASKQEISKRTKSFAAELQKQTVGRVQVSIVDGFSVIGGGSCPDVKLPTELISLMATHVSPNGIEQKLRAFTPPIITRLEKDRVLIDLRTVLPEQEDNIISACAQI